MKATELRIGNYVGRQSSKMITNRDEVYQIENVTRKTESKYDPIPISEEWILSFNFKEFRYMFNNELLIGYVPFNLISHEYNTYILQKYGDKYYMMTNGDNRQIISSGFDYVHQLQNIFFALTNRELISNKVTK